MNRFSVSLVLFLIAVFPLFAQEGNPDKGKELFQANCSSCHKLEGKSTGPALLGVATRLSEEKGLDKEWLHKWIMNSKSLIDAGDSYANEVFNTYNKNPMTTFDGVLAPADVDDIIAYMENPPAEKQETAGAVVSDVDKNKEAGNTWITVFLFSTIVIVLGFALFALKRLIKARIQSTDFDRVEKVGVKSFKDFLRVYKNESIIIASILAILVLYFVWAWLMGIGVDKGYKPNQPIYFSHKVHSGIQEIDCMQCHTGAKEGKTSEIPPVSTCMNCHKQIEEYKGDYVEEGKSKEFYTAEIQKIYDYAGWDKEKQEYIRPAQPIQWTKLHNMQDFVSFNHAQHAVVAKDVIEEKYRKEHPMDKAISCKECHGEVDNMDQLQVANDFTMEFCVDCHRTVEVDMNNGYNKEYFTKLHEDMKAKYGKEAEEKGKITPEEVGGLECGKCHY